jgi:hypothetical protein
VPSEAEDSYVWLRSLPFPRPLVWKTFIYRRRIWYGFLSLLLLLTAVGIPLFYGLQQMSSSTTADKTRPNQIALYLGAMIVVSYVVFVHSLFKQYDDLKWLGQRGSVTEANILAVFRNQHKLIVGYRFWDDQGREREREAVIDIDASHPVPELKAGMVIPLLYDPQKPEQRNYLWAEASIYLTLRLRAPSA